MRQPRSRREGLIPFALQGAQHYGQAAASRTNRPGPPGRTTGNGWTSTKRPDELAPATERDPYRALTLVEAGGAQTTLELVEAEGTLAVPDRGVDLVHLPARRETSPAPIRSARLGHRHVSPA